MRENFITKKQNDKIVKIEDTCQKLVNILAMRNYTSGGRIDYYDK